MKKHRFDKTRSSTKTAKCAVLIATTLLFSGAIESFAYGASDWDTSTEAGLTQTIQQVGANMGIINTTLTPPALSCGSTAVDQGIGQNSWENYGGNRKIRAMLDVAWNNRQSKPINQAYSYVKQALYQTGIVPQGSLTSTKPAQAVGDLKSQGFVNLLDSPAYADLKEHPEMAPVGAIIVYAGDPNYPWSKDGDIQIHMNGGFLSDYYSSRPTNHQVTVTHENGKTVEYPDHDHFRVIGVMMKPSLKPSRAQVEAPVHLKQNQLLTQPASSQSAVLDSYYANSPKIRQMINAAWVAHKPATTFECYHAVKQALYQSGIVPRGSLHGGAASSAVSDLEQQGFVNLLDNPTYANLRNTPEEAPIGAIVVYAGDPSHEWSKWGDVQIHMLDGNGKGAWVSDYFSHNAMIRQTTVFRDSEGNAIASYADKDYFHVIGVMIDPSAAFTSVAHR
ncbi:MAG: hypothetical protein P4M08_10035 [Oligoflexia bacterium]|nr:hypothetical protein [Oligoflexia bacterium]